MFTLFIGPKIFRPQITKSKLKDTKINYVHHKLFKEKDAS